MVLDHGDDSVVAADFHRNGVARDGVGPILAFVVGAHQAIVGGHQQRIASHGDFIDIEPRILSRGFDQFKHIVDELVKAGADEAVIVALLIEAIELHAIVTIAGTHIDDTIGILSHAADHQGEVAHLMPGDAVVIGLVDAATFGADVNLAIGMAFVKSVVVKDSRGLATHVVGAHSKPIERLVGIVPCCRSLHCLKHVGRINQASVLVSAKTAHKALRIVVLGARNIVSTLVSNSQSLA